MLCINCRASMRHKVKVTTFFLTVLGTLYSCISMRKSSRLHLAELKNVSQTSETLLASTKVVLEESYYEDNNSRLLFANDLEDSIKAGRHDGDYWRDLNVLNTIIPETLQTMRNPCWWENHPGETTCDKLRLMNKALKLPGTQENGPVLRCLPYFYLIGQAKCGTTDLFTRITQHPSILSPMTKEPFWVFPLRFQKGCSSIETYLDFLQTSSNRIKENYLASSVSALITGDGSTTTMSGNTWWNMLPGNEGCEEPCITNANIVYQMNPKAKILVSLRNPASRSFSYYIMKARILKYNVSKEHFHGLVVNEITEFQNCISRSSLRSCVMNSTEENYLITAIGLRSSIYHIHLQDWMKVFPREQIYVVHFEHYIKHMPDTLAGVYNFLEVDLLSDQEMQRIAEHKIQNQRPLSGQKLGDMLPETKTLLDKFFKPFNAQLATLLDNDVFTWTV
ncbi:carbohydrate sulfotransferase 15-like [Haliotis rufescens]|uniref:carbohydrate sulfotransferase 15-like n=1 Tax=Haliotis rufescens TaxID=6454 RepID=UPI00201F44A6|nr:carbohydrate sulfotransferase 15-like [Haliotis rufescens]